MKKHRDYFTIDVRKPQFKWFLFYVLLTIIGAVQAFIWIVEILIRLAKAFSQVLNLIFL